MTAHVELWYVDFARASDPALLAQYAAIVTDDERAQAERFRFPGGKAQFLISRALVRTALAAAAGVAPQAWRFVRNRYGKPAVAAPAGTAWQFNLSHTRGLAICGLRRDGPIGVDVEDRSRATDYLGLSRRYFAVSEADALAALPAEQRPARFFEYWTLKEAFIKARGFGLSLPLDRFWFTLAPDRPPQIGIDPTDDERAEDWQFVQLRLQGVYQAAIAVRTPPAEPLTVSIRETIPLGWTGEPHPLVADGSDPSAHAG